MDRSPATRTLPGRRELKLPGRTLEYRITRSRRRTISIVVGADGVAVRAPLTAPWHAIEGFLAEKARWIAGRIAWWREAPRPATIAGASGEALPVMGEELRLDVRAGRGAARREAGALILAVRDPLDRTAVRSALVRGLRQIALANFAPRAAQYAALLGLRAPPVALSSARARWGSCSARGRIRLAWRLVHLPPRLADYVIAHEVAHLVEPNHAPRFWRLVESLYPDFRDARRALRRAGAALPLIEGLP